MKKNPSRLFSSAQLARLRGEYARISSVDPTQPTYKKLQKQLDSMTQDQLKQLAGARIKFISKLALNRIVRSNPGGAKFKVGDKVKVGRKIGEIAHIQLSHDPSYPNAYRVTDLSAKDPYKQTRLEGGNYISERRIKLLRNPSRRVHASAQAHKLFESFTGHELTHAKKIDVPDMPKEVVKIGTIDGVLYTTVRDGVTERYIHEFKRKARPTFAVSPDGRQLFMLGGAYNFTERGIVDKR
jgi:hypothetical protein